jgi:hypothetical protein
MNIVEVVIPCIVLYRVCIVLMRRSFVAMTFCCTCETATYSSEPKEERERALSTSYLPFSLSFSLFIHIQFGRAILSDNWTEQFHQICCRYRSRIQLQQLCQIFQDCQVTNMLLPVCLHPSPILFRDSYHSPACDDEGIHALQAHQLPSHEIH